MAVQCTSSATDLVVDQEYSTKDWIFQTKIAVLPPPTPHPNSSRQKLYCDSVWAHQNRLPGDFVLPESLFDGKLVISHCQTGVSFTFDAFAALSSCQSAPASYYSQYSGAINVDRAKLRGILGAKRLIEPPEGFATPTPTTRSLPVHKLTRRDDEIKFFEDIKLYEHQGDKEYSCLSCKIRVMSTNWLVLLRMFTMDGDNVKLHDTRVYGETGSRVAFRDYTLREGSIDQVKQAVSGTRPFTASLSREVIQSKKYFCNPEQVYESLSPASTAADVVVVAI